VEEALSAGIKGYVLKLVAAEDLIAAAYDAIRGETFVSPSLGWRSRDTNDSGSGDLRSTG
jgi:DNA-binding NarL/FixJ family response regulator